MLQQVDLHWKEHLAAMDYLRQGIHLRGYAQKNPKQEYKREAFEMFGAMLDQVKRDVVTILAKARVRSPEEMAAEEERRRMTEQLQYRHDEAPSAMAETAAEAEAGEAGTEPSSAFGTEPARAGAPAAAGQTSPAGCRAGRARGARSARRDARWAGTNPVPAAPARSTSSATVALTDTAVRQHDRAAGRIVVAAGILRDAAGRILLAQRPPGGHVGGFWEFPGGKLQPGE